MGVTAVLNAAQGSMSDWNYVNTKDVYYSGVGIDFLGVPAIDLKWYPICNHFDEAANFIEKVIKSRGTLHCCMNFELVLSKLPRPRKTWGFEFKVSSLHSLVFFI